MIIAISIILAVLAVALVVLVLMQQGKNKNLSGAIAGSTNNNYYGKGKVKNTDKLLSRLTLIVTILFVLIVLFMYISQDVQDVDSIIGDNYNQTEAAE